MGLQRISNPRLEHWIEALTWQFELQKHANTGRQQTKAGATEGTAPMLSEIMILTLGGLLHPTTDLEKNDILTL